MEFLDKTPFWLLILAAVFLAVAPYPAEPLPHAAQKVIMLINGELSKPLDIFDLLFHGVLMPALIGIKWFRMRKSSGPAE